MSDMMRELAEHAYTMTAHDYCANPVGSRDWTLFWRGWQAALAEHPARGEAARAGTVRHTVDDGVSTTQVIWIGDKPRAGTAVYLAPPAPVVPDGWKLAMRQLVYYARTSGGTAGPDPTLMEACEACEKLLAAAPTVAAKGVQS